MSSFHCTLGEAEDAVRKVNSCGGPCHLSPPLLHSVASFFCSTKTTATLRGPSTVLALLLKGATIFHLIFSNFFLYRLRSLTGQQEGRQVAAPPLRNEHSIPKAGGLPSMEKGRSPRSAFFKKKLFFEKEHPKSKRHFQKRTTI